MEVNSTCAKMEVIFARGSGRPPTNNESTRFKSQLTKRVKEGISSHYYELGSENYGGHKYPAVDIGLQNGNALGAYVTSGYGGDYGKSVNEGYYELQSYISQRYDKCKSAGSYFVLGGYSQGAQVVGESLRYMPEEIRDRVIFVGLFGDPKLFLPEGGVFNPPACQGKNLSLYRRIIADCHLSNGRLGSRNPYIPNDMKSKTGLWCLSDDFVYGTTQYPYATGHDAYANKGSAIDSAAQEAAKRLLTALKNEPKPVTPPHSSPPPTPNYDDLIDITHTYGMGLNGNDVLFVVDRSAAMQSLLPEIRRYISNTGDKIIEKDGRYTIASYCGVETSPGVSETAAGALPFDFPLSYMNVYTSIYTTACPASPSSAPLYALNTSMQHLNWQNGAAKSVILFTNNPGPLASPDQYGVTNSMVARTALSIDPVNIYPVVPQSSASVYQQLADLTSGQVVPFTGDMTQAADVAYDKIQTRPVPFLKNTEYVADPGQEITFDASDSYVIDSTITRYDWDFDGDGIFDASTTDPTIDHTYNQKFDGIMQVRVTAANGTIANASATVKIGTYVAPRLPAAPNDLTATVVATEDGKSIVHLSWDALPDDLNAAWSLTMNGVPLGLMTPDRTSIDVTDVDRSIDNDFGIAGTTDAQLVGPATILTLERPQPESATTTSSSTQPLVAKTTSINNLVITDDADGNSTITSVLGMESRHIATLLTNSKNTSAKSTSDKGQTLQNIAWYWWPLAAIGASSGAWWLVRKRRQ